MAAHDHATCTFCLVHGIDGEHPAGRSDSTLSTREVMKHLNPALTGAAITVLQVERSLHPAGSGYPEVEVGSFLDRQHDTGQLALRRARERRRAAEEMQSAISAAADYAAFDNGWVTLSGTAEIAPRSDVEIEWRPEHRTVRSLLRALRFWWSGR